MRLDEYGMPTNANYTLSQLHEVERLSDEVVATFVRYLILIHVSSFHEHPPSYRLQSWDEMSVRASDLIEIPQGR